MDSLTLHSPAKINLRLEILGKRNDGYHEIRTILQKISFYDDITLKVSPQKGIKVTVDNPSIPANNKNLAYKAALLLMKDQKISTGVSIHIKKKIPAGSGLGGGSSNAATTLRGLNRLLELNLTDKYLQQLSRSLGADVPFFLSGSGTALATGIGEKLKPLKLQTKLWFLLIFPNFTISTSWAYNTCDKYNLLTKRKKNIILKSYIRNFDSVISLLLNDFERVVIPFYPEIKTIKNNLVRAGAAGSLLSGSGSSVFGVFSDKEDIEKAHTMLPYQAGHKAFITHSL